MADERICPHCRQSIFDDDALLCHFCGESLRRTSAGWLGKVTGISWAVAAVMLLSLFLFLIKH